MIIADHQIVVPWRHLDLVARFVFLGEMNECVRGLAWEILVGYCFFWKRGSDIAPQKSHGKNYVGN